MRILTGFKGWWNGLSSPGRRVAVAVICAAFLALHLFILKLDFVALALLAVIFLILFPDIFSEIPTPGGPFKLKQDYEKTLAQAGEDDPRITRRNKMAGLLFLLTEKADDVIRAQGFGKLTALATYERVQKRVLEDVNNILKEIAEEKKGK